MADVTATVPSLSAVAPITSLPSEILYQVFSYLSPIDLARISCTCHRFHDHAYDNQLWQNLIQQNLHKGSGQLTSFEPAESFRNLYIAHHPYWFLPRQQLWFADNYPHGKLLLARYDSRRGCIEAYSVTAERGIPSAQTWELDGHEVLAHSFHPRVNLDLNQSVVQLDLEQSPFTSSSSSAFVSSPGGGVSIRVHTSDWTLSSLDAYEEPQTARFGTSNGYTRLQREVRMDIHNNASSRGIFSRFMLTRALQPPALNHPHTRVWPPRNIPAIHRVRNESATSYKGVGHKPATNAEVCDSAFRLRKGMSFAARGAMGPLVLADDEVTTYATLPKEAYTPTPEKPYRGIWVGDYSGHGCEFLVVLQPDAGHENPLPPPVREALRRPLELETTLIEVEDDDDDTDDGMDTTGGDNTNAWNTIPSQDENSPTDSLPGEPVWSPGEEPIFDASHPPTSGDTAGSTEQPRGSNLSGRLEAIKLTGDPNIPRGEYTFIAPDIGDSGLVRVAHEKLFKGARIVRSAGHIAARGFRDDTYIPSQLVLISHDTLAQYWVPFGHVSYYRRVNLDKLMSVG